MKIYSKAFSQKDITKLLDRWQVYLIPKIIMRIAAIILIIQGVFQHQVILLNKF